MVTSSERVLLRSQRNGLHQSQKSAATNYTNSTNFFRVIREIRGKSFLAKARMLSGRGAVGLRRLQPAARSRLFLFTAERIDDDEGFRQSGPPIRFLLIFSAMQLRGPILHS